MSTPISTSRRTVLAGGLGSAASAVGLSACGNGGASSADSSSVPSGDPDAKVTITFMEAMAAGAQKEALVKITKDFMAANPNITVKLEEQPDYGTLQTKISAQTGAGEPPTIAQVYGNWAAEYAEAEVIVPLDAYIAESPQYNDLFDGIKADLQLPDGKTWMWPFNKSVVVQYYNTDLVKEAPSSWDEFATVAKKVSTGDVVALSIDPGSSAAPAGGTALFEILAEGNGDPVFGTDGTPQFTKPGVVQALEYLVDLKKAGALALGKDYPGQVALGAEKGAFDLSSVASYPFNLEAVGDKFTLGVGQLPPGAKKPANQLAGTNIALFAQADENQKAAAWKYLQFLTEPAQQAYWSAQTGYLPVCQQATKEKAFTAYAKKAPFVTEATEQLNTATSLPPQKWINACSGFLSVAIQQAVGQGKDPAAVLKTAQASADKAKKQAG
ncbi:ABC transporter substrate-binding protein [Microlunatus soli]|uniref:Carbohydrate ABC transporter substrate-binding protein, CUT1 family n=1 Tax=Microlunatus soli TaxID=630515 RepID=A0A1H1QC56_9ACTN|nr:ABC transporter substrate-binding protein [Microlunatus soli]SDS21010.1 carbohydrate ABC transporter substrate-binding protein, CUT1 family [Microlunatus soli]